MGHGRTDEFRKDGGDYKDVLPYFRAARIGLEYQTEVRRERMENAIQNTKLESIAQILDCIDTNKRPLWQLVEAMDLLAGILQTVDARKLQKPMYYFSQREWRITKVLSSSLLGYDLVSDDQGGEDEFTNNRKRKHCLVKELPHLAKSGLDQDWLSRCYVVLGNLHLEKFFRDYISVVVCPRSAREEVGDMLDRYFGLLAPPMVHPEEVLQSWMTFRYIRFCFSSATSPLEL